MQKLLTKEESEELKLGYACIRNQSGGELNITGGSVVSQAMSALGSVNGATINITGGSIFGFRNVLDNSGEVTISNEPRLYNEEKGYYGVYNKEGGNLNIYGGNLNFASAGIYNYSGATLIIGKEDSNSIITPSITATNSAVYTPSNSFTFNSGILRSSENSSVINAIISNTKTNYSKDVIDNKASSGYYELYWH